MLAEVVTGVLVQGALVTYLMMTAELPDVI